MGSSNVGDELVSVLEVSDNQAINAEDGNLEDVSFYQKNCTKAHHKVWEAFIDHGGLLLMKVMML